MLNLKETANGWGMGKVKQTQTDRNPIIGNTRNNK
jgi:hypothetical protein